MCTMYACNVCIHCMYSLCVFIMYSLCAKSAIRRFKPGAKLGTGSALNVNPRGHRLKTRVGGGSRASLASFARALRSFPIVKKNEILPDITRYGQVPPDAAR